MLMILILKEQLEQYPRFRAAFNWKAMVKNNALEQSRKQAFTVCNPKPLLQLDEIPSVAEVRAAIPAYCFEIKARRAWLAILEHLALALASIAGLIYWHEWARAKGFSELLVALITLPGCWLLGQVYVGWFVIGHDCGHRAFSKKVWVNDLIGHFCTGFIGLSFEGWRIVHNFHHAHTQIRGVDPDWAETQMTRQEFEESVWHKKLAFLLAYATPVGVLIGIWHGNLRKNFLPWGYPQIELDKKQIFRVWAGNVFSLFFVALICFALNRVGGVWAIVFCYLAPCFLGGVSGTMLTFLHHTRTDAFVFDKADWTAARGQIAATFEVRFPALLEWFWKDINIHLPHHVAPKVPWYNLKQASENIHLKFENRVNAQTPFGLKLLTDVWRKPFLKDEKS